MLADRLTVLSAPITADELVERPYVIGQNEIMPAVDRPFRRDEELVVVFLVYNPMVTPDKHFDLQVEYHFFRQGRRRQGRGARSGRIRRRGTVSGTSTTPIRSASTRQ